jgi:DNA-binding transcriptional LysR family regulator
MEIRQLRNFVATCDLGSFTKAATQIGVTQPALSQSISELERVTGHKLLLRQTRGTRITAAGESLLGFARVIVRQHDQAKMELARLSGAGAGSIQVGLHAAFPESVVIRAIEALRIKEPLLSVTIKSAAIDSAMLVSKLADLSWDFAVAAYEEGGDFLSDDRLRRDLALTVLSRSSSVVCAAKNHPLHKSESVSAADLCAYPWVVTSQRTADKIGALVAKQERGAKIRVGILTETLSGLVEAVACTNMLCIAPNPLVALRDGDVLPLRQQIVPAFWIRWGIFSNKNIELTGPTRSLMNFIARESGADARRER